MKQTAVKGFFGEYGGRYSPEVLLPALEELEKLWLKAKASASFQKRFQSYLRDYAGRPSLLTHAARLSKAYGVNIYLKREDLNHTGSHKINNALGQALLALEMKKTRVIAETGAGQHGVATATVAAHFGLQCTVFMGEEDTRRQKLNVYRMQLLGAEVVPVKTGNRTLKDATNEAMREWAKNVDTTHYIIGSVMGPHPFPSLVRDFQSVIGKESRAQFKKLTGKLPTAVVACIGGGSNAMGIFAGFLPDKKVRLIGVEAGGRGDKLGDNSASISFGSEGVFHGMKSMFIQGKGGQIIDAHSISAGLDYPGVGPEHAYLFSSKRAEYVHVSDLDALDAFRDLCRHEGIIPALESSHALAYVKKSAKKFSKGSNILVCLSGRGDKDVQEVALHLGLEESK